ncbi:hypothetical protein R84B8_01615 [Treponema sp. R8-4-B8]
MKKFIAFVIGLSIAAVCFAQSDPVEGYWISVDEKTNKVTAGWQIYQQNGVLYGRILSLSEDPKGTIASKVKESYKDFPLPGKVNQMEVAGPPWIFGLTKKDTGDWRGGKIIDPADGNIYNCRITFHKADGKKYQNDTLEMRGEIGLGIGRSQFWRKSDAATAGNLWPR